MQLQSSTNAKNVDNGCNENLSILSGLPHIDQMYPVIDTSPFRVKKMYVATGMKEQHSFIKNPRHFLYTRISVNSRLKSGCSFHSTVRLNCTQELVLFRGTDYDSKEKLFSGDLIKNYNCIHDKYSIYFKLIFLATLSPRSSLTFR